MNTDGSDQTRLSANTTNDESPRWSPDNSRILFQSDRDNSQGRFAGTDPYLPMADSDKEEFFKRYLKQPQNWNRYAYCISNPLIFIDPKGLGWYVKKGEAIGHPTWFDDDKVDREFYEGVQAFVYKT